MRDKFSKSNQLYILVHRNNFTAAQSIMDNTWGRLFLYTISTNTLGVSATSALPVIPGSAAFATNEVKILACNNERIAFGAAQSISSSQRTVGVAVTNRANSTPISPLSRHADLGTSGTARQPVVSDYSTSEFAYSFTPMGGIGINNIQVEFSNLTNLNSSPPVFRANTVLGFSQDWAYYFDNNILYKSRRSK